MTDQLRIDAAFLAGFIVGQYDVKGEEKPPAYISAILERCLNHTTPDEIENADTQDIFVFKTDKTNSADAIDPKELAARIVKASQEAVVHCEKYNEDFKRPEDREIRSFRDVHDKDVVDTTEPDEKEQLHTGNPVPRRFKSLTDAEKADIQKKSQRGLSMIFIGKPYGVTSQTVANWLMKMKKERSPNFSDDEA